MDDFNLTYANQEAVLQLDDDVSLSISLASSDQWKDVSVTITSSYAALRSSSPAKYKSVSTMMIINTPTITEVTIGASYPDLLQDFIVYDTPLNDSTAHPLASFLSQCYCEESFNETSEECVDGTSGASSVRLATDSPFVSLPLSLLKQ